MAYPDHLFLFLFSATSAKPRQKAEDMAGGFYDVKIPLDLAGNSFLSLARLFSFSSATGCGFFHWADSISSHSCLHSYSEGQKFFLKSTYIRNNDHLDAQAQGAGLGRWIWACLPLWKAWREFLRRGDSACVTGLNPSMRRGFRKVLALN